jgi:hypothetical protein
LLLLFPLWLFPLWLFPLLLFPLLLLLSGDDRWPKITMLTEIANQSAGFEDAEHMRGQRKGSDGDATGLVMHHQR